MLQNAYFLAKIGADTAENEQHFAEILPKTRNYPTGPVPSSDARRAGGRRHEPEGLAPRRGVHRAGPSVWVGAPLRDVQQTFAPL